MRKYGSYEVVRENYLPYEQTVIPQGSTSVNDQGQVGAVGQERDSSLPSPFGRGAGGEGQNLPADYTLDSENRILKDGEVVGVLVDGEAKVGFDTPSRKLEFYQPVMAEWGWTEPDYVLPHYLKSHVHLNSIHRTEGEMLLLPTFRLPTLIHTRSANSKWLYEISHRNPVWLHPEDAQRIGVVTDDLIKIETEIGYFISKVWITEGIRPGVLAMSHHLGRWRLTDTGSLSPGTSALVKLEESNSSEFSMRQLQAAKAYKSSDPDTSRIWWEDIGVHQNITHAVHPDPVSGMHCWHQKALKVSKAGPDDRHGDIRVDTNKSMQIYHKWLALTHPAPGPGGLRRPLWFKRPLKPDKSVYYISE
jgi:anaerobic selenocysteine-containing dehydrogenase